MVQHLLPVKDNADWKGDELSLNKNWRHTLTEVEIQGLKAMASSLIGELLSLIHI